MRVKMLNPSPPAPTASARGPCPTVIKNVGRPGTGSLPSTIAPPPFRGGGVEFFGGRGGEGATVSEFLLLRIQIQNKKKHFWGGSGWGWLGRGLVGVCGGGGGERLE